MDVDADQAATAAAGDVTMTDVSAATAATVVTTPAILAKAAAQLTADLQGGPTTVGEDAPRGKAKPKAAPAGVPFKITKKALHDTDVEKFVLLTGFGSPAADYQAVVSLAANHPRVALLAARRLLFTLDGVATPNDRIEVLSQLPASLATYVGIQMKWLDLAPKVDRSLYATPTGRPEERGLFGYPQLDWLMGDWPMALAGPATTGRFW